ncbi:hypothetical protein RclHR1_00340011 [Rhizophagus clarus]|uniref:Uncharacterized protein n=1 Tax=Rhizophagus clarus TaxID=94130 RepID=A0A2Z6RAF0_9GLOM|nr:hypothetical protein RclHR1_00340011 [Rhizophagus clarus]
MFDILNGKRENPIPNINDKFVSHYKNVRPNIHQVISGLNNISPIELQLLNTLLSLKLKDIIVIGELESEDSDLASCEVCDINSDKISQSSTRIFI